MNIPLRNFILFTALTFLSSPFVMAQQAKSKSKPIRQVTQNTLPAPKTEQVTPPVKGVGTVVKRNPGSGASKISGTTNALGETTVTITEKGNYAISVVQPNQDGANRPKTQGGPIQGVRIGLAKNPPGVVSKFLIPNAQGVVELSNLEPGNYILKVITSEVNCPPGFIMNNGLCEPLPKVATDQPVKAATNIRPELVNPGETTAPAAITEQVGLRNTTQSGVRPLILADKGISKPRNIKDGYGDTKPLGGNLVSNPCYETIKTLYCYDGNNNCKMICDNVNNSFCGMTTLKKEIPCNTATPTGTVNSLIKTYIFKEKPINTNELSYGEIREIIHDILPSFNVDNITLNSYRDNYLLLVEGSQNDVPANVNIMLSNDNGKLYTSEDIRILDCSDPKVIMKSIKRKHVYVGHVTLMR